MNVESCPILRVLTTKMFDYCLTWLRNRRMATLVDTSTLVSLHEFTLEKWNQMDIIPSLSKLTLFLFLSADNFAKV